jgi:hypothetical protein
LFDKELNLYYFVFMVVTTNSGYRVEPRYPRAHTIPQIVLPMMNESGLESWLIFKYFGLGIGADFLRVSISGNGSDGFLGGGWSGKLDFDYSGLMIYGKLYF